MFKIDCPHCGPRSEDEFEWGGPAHLQRPGPAEKVSDKEWAEYLYMRDNAKGKCLERWCHTHGCAEWFNMERDSVTHKITAVYQMGETAPVTGGRHD